MKRYTKKGPRRSRAMPVSSRRFVVTQHSPRSYITAGKAYKVTFYGRRGEEIVSDTGSILEIVSPLWSCGCAHLDDRKWRWATL